MLFLQLGLFVCLAQAFCPKTLAGIDAARAKELLIDVGLQYDFQCDAKRLGSGAYGSVYLCHRKIFSTPRFQETATFALKLVELFHEDGTLDITTVREIAILQRARGAHHLVQLQFVTFKDRYAFIAMDYYPHNLRSILTKNGKLPPQKVELYAGQIAAGLQELHAGLGVGHFDLKPENVLVSANQNHLVLADFGLSREFTFPVPASHRGSGQQPWKEYDRGDPLRPTSPALHDEVCTLWYRSPEHLLGAPAYGPQTDLWSLGVLIAEMQNGSPCFQGRSVFDQIFQIFHTTGTPSSDVFPELTELPYLQQGQKFPTFPKTRDLETQGHASGLLSRVSRSLLQPEPSQRNLDHVFEELAGERDPSGWIASRDQEEQRADALVPIREELLKFSAKYLQHKGNSLRCKKIEVYRADLMVKKYLGLHPEFPKRNASLLVNSALALSIAYSGSFEIKFSDVSSTLASLPQGNALFVEMVHRLILAETDVYPNLRTPFGLLLKKWQDGEISRFEFEMSEFLLESLRFAPALALSPQDLIHGLVQLSGLGADMTELFQAHGGDARQILMALRGLLGDAWITSAEGLGPYWAQHQFLVNRLKLLFNVSAPPEDRASRPVLWSRPLSGKWLKARLKHRLWAS